MEVLSPEVTSTQDFVVRWNGLQANKITGSPQTQRPRITACCRSRSTIRHRRRDKR